MSNSCHLYAFEDSIQLLVRGLQQVLHITKAMCSQSIVVLTKAAVFEPAKQGWLLCNWWWLHLLQLRWLWHRPGASVGTAGGGRVDFLLHPMHSQCCADFLVGCFCYFSGILTRCAFTRCDQVHQCANSASPVTWCVDQTVHVTSRHWISHRRLLLSGRTFCSESDLGVAPSAGIPTLESGDQAASGRSQCQCTGVCTCSLV
mmetsp:Transcript_22783/g.53172  ORF Transcript_22783/g.53172 Transcript_22783/m.53172 type:complete len:202 (+) Transcript_22783:85-690(+)